MIFGNIQPKFESSSPNLENEAIYIFKVVIRIIWYSTDDKQTSTLPKSWENLTEGQRIF